MEDKFIGFTNEVVEGKAKIYTKLTKSVGYVYPASIAVSAANISGLDLLELIMNEAISEQDYDLVALENGKLNPPQGFEKNFTLINYELGRIRISRQVAENLIRNLQDILERNKI